MKLIQENLEKKVEYQKLEQSLWLDFNRYSKVSYKAFEEELLFANALDSTSYRFSSKMIVKALDTFQISGETIKVFFGGKAVEHGEIDAIKLEANSTYQNKSLFVFKQNDAVKFMD